MNYGWSVMKTLTVCLCGIAIVAVLAAAAVIANRNADNHRTQVIRACVNSGQSWINGSCVRGSVVKP